jgi:hypothetical protein
MVFTIHLEIDAAVFNAPFCCARERNPSEGKTTEVWGVKQKSHTRSGFEAERCIDSG